MYGLRLLSCLQDWVPQSPACPALRAHASNDAAGLHIGQKQQLLRLPSTPEHSGEVLCIAVAMLTCADSSGPGCPDMQEFQTCLSLP